MATCSAQALTLAEKVSQRSSPPWLVGTSKGLDFPLIAQPGIAALQSVGAQLGQRFQILHAAPGDFGHAPLLRQSARELQHFDIVERLLQDC